MRTVVYALVLANLGFWAWLAWFAPQPPVATRYEGPGLTLLRELEREEPPPEPLAAPPSAPSARCVGVGPFVEPDNAEAARALLAENGYDVRSVSAETEIWDGYWVYVGQIANMEQARATLTLIEAQGIEDAYIIQNSDSGILISLGVYSDLSRASGLADRVGDLDMQATVAERTRLADVVWLEFDQRGEDSTGLNLLQQIVDELEQRDCSAGL